MRTEVRGQNQTQLKSRDEEEEEDDYDEERGVVYPSPLKYPLHPLQVVFS